MSRDDRGAAMVLALALLPLILLAAFVALALGQQAVARQQAAAAADITALGAAQTDGDPCTVAQQLAGANHVSLVACAVDGTDMVVRVSRPAPPLVVRLFAMVGTPAPDVVGVARAGPPPANR
jgi:secretion/DNA translocation related TadE-like protein